MDLNAHYAIVEQDFLSKGFSYPSLEADGDIHRFKIHENVSKKNGWYVCYLHNSFLAGSYGDWSTGEKHNFCTASSITSKEKDKIFKKIDKKFEQERLIVQEESAAESQKFIKEYCSISGPLNEYLVRKKIPGLHGALLCGSDLIVTLQDLEQKVWGYQRIYPDGKKIFSTGLKKKANFFPIGSMDEDEIYYCEGFATGCSIREAINKTVIVCFDTGNLLPVVTSFREKWPEKKFIFCGDDDIFTENNPGKTYAEKAAKAGLASVVFPKFQSLVSKPTDFNDLFVLEGSRAVSDQILGVKAEVNILKPLGFTKDGNYFYTSSANKSISVLKTHSTQELFRLMPIHYWESKYQNEKTGRVSWDDARSDLMDACHRRGIYNPGRERGYGVWSDAGRTVVHLGDRVWCNGEEISLDQFKSKFIYELCTPLDSIRTDPLNCEEIETFMNEFQNLSFSDSKDCFLLLGWLAVAPICGIMPWRTHFWINGEAGSGKTAIFEILNHVLSQAYHCIYRSGKTTEAHIRTESANYVIPIMMDEFEANGGFSEQGRVGNILDLFRQASSNSDADIGKGSANHKAHKFHAKFAAGVGSIDAELKKDADKSRFVMISTKKGAHTSQEWHDLKDRIYSIASPEFCQRLFSRIIRQIPITLHNFNIYKSAIQTVHKKDARTADQYGVIYAGFSSLISDHPVSMASAEETVSGINFDDETHLSNGSDEAHKRVEWLMSVKLNLGGGMQKSIRELYDEKQPNSIGRSELNRHGIGVLDDGSLFLPTGPHAELEKIIKSSPWPSGFREGLLKIGTHKQIRGILGKEIRTRGIVINPSQFSY